MKPEFFSTESGFSPQIHRLLYRFDHGDPTVTLLRPNAAGTHIIHKDSLHQTFLAIGLGGCYCTITVGSQNGENVVTWTHFLSTLTTQQITKIQELNSMLSNKQSKIIAPERANNEVVALLTSALENQRVEVMSYDPSLFGSRDAGTLVVSISPEKNTLIFVDGKEKMF